MLCRLFLKFFLGDECQVIDEGGGGGATHKRNDFKFCSVDD